MSRSSPYLFLRQMLTVQRTTGSADRVEHVLETSHIGVREGDTEVKSLIRRGRRQSRESIWDAWDALVDNEVRELRAGIRSGEKQECQQGIHSASVDEESSYISLLTILKR